MFFRKKSQAAGPSNFAPKELTVFNDIAQTLFFGMNEGDNAASLSAKLSFDEQQRVTGVGNPLLNGAPKLPGPDLLEKLNHVSAQLLDLDEKYRLKALTVQVADGQITNAADYLTA